MKSHWSLRYFLIIVDEPSILMKLLFTIAFVLGITMLQAQDFEKLKDFKIASKADAKQAEPIALECANYLMTHPVSTEQNRGIALKVVIMWMSDTPDYQFAVDGSAAALMKKDEDILGVYMAAMCKWALENSSQAKDAAAMKLGTFNILLDYAVVPENNVKQTKELKKALEAKKDGKLKEYLNI